MLLIPARPTAWATDSTLGVVEKWNDVRIALSSNKELTIKHFSKTTDGYILSNRTIVVCLIIFPILLNDSVCILVLQPYWSHEARNRRTC